MTVYQKVIKELLEEDGHSDIDPRHIEGFMRLQYGSLNSLDHITFDAEVRLCVKCIKMVGHEEAEKNAKSFGL